MPAQWAKMVVIFPTSALPSFSELGKKKLTETSK